MKLSDLSIHRPVFAWMIMVGLLVFGAISFSRMGVSALPDVDFPIVNVRLTLEGAAPEVMELDVVDPVESALMSVEGIKSISSSAKSGQADVTVELELGKDIDVAVQEVQTRIAQAQRQLPDGIDPPIVTKSNPEDRPILWLGVTSDKMSPQQLMAFVRDQVKDRFLTVPGVADVFLGGYVDPNLRVWVKQPELDRYQLSVQDVIGAIQSEHSEPPSGRLEGASKEFNVRTMGEADSVEEFSKIEINRRGGSPNYTPIPLNRVAEVQDGLDDVRRISRIGGKVAVGLGIRKQRGSNTVEVARLVKERMKELRAELPKDVELAVNFDSSKFIQDSISELNFTLLLSALLTALVCWIFLGSWTATLNVILAIPVSIVGSFIVLSALNFTLNTFTVLGLSLAIGIVVDDAIMVLENIVRHAEMGKNRLLSALHGSREIAFAAMAATAAIIAIFMPVAFMKGIIGRYFLQFGVTISVAVALSLLEALTLTPMRCSQFLKVEPRTTRFGHAVERAFERAAELYARIIPVLLRNRWKTVLVSIAFFLVSLLVCQGLKREFVPAQDQGLFLVNLKAPQQSSLEYTDGKTKELEAILGKNPSVLRYFVSVGGFGGDVNTSMAFVTLKPMDERSKSQDQVINEIRNAAKSIQGARVFVQDLSKGGFGSGRGYPIEFSIRGPDFKVLADSSKKLMDAMVKSGTAVDMDSDFQGDAIEVHIIPDRKKAALRGVSVADIGQTISAMLGGVVVGKYSSGGHRNDIRVKLLGAEHLDDQGIRSIRVRNNRGELIPLSDVVHITREPSLLSIQREDRERAISIYGNVAPGSSQQEALDTAEKLASKILPNGYRLVPSGSAQTMKESFESLIVAFVLGLLVAYMVLASQFNSFIDPITVFVALPFSFSGAFVALWLGHQTINIYSMIGLILLMGIVKKNSILLVDFTNQKRDEGLGVDDSLIAACPLRLRPILMTSFATVAGAIPPALGFGPGSESRVPMALAVLGGVVVSTVLTLFVVPCVYSLFARHRRNIAAEAGEAEMPMNLGSPLTPNA